MKLRIFTKKTEQEKRRYLRKNMTRAEILLWYELKNKMLGVRFLRQYSIGKFVVDFYEPEIKLAIEVDGVTHSSPEEIEYDAFRQNIIEENKITFLRLTNPEIYDDLFNVLEKIKTQIEEMKKLLYKKEPHKDGTSWGAYSRDSVINITILQYNCQLINTNIMKNICFVPPSASVKPKDCPCMWGLIASGLNSIIINVLTAGLLKSQMGVSLLKAKATFFR